MGGAVDLERAREFVEHALDSAVDESQVKALLAHPLLAVEESLMFRYDVVRHHFRNVFVGWLFRNDTAVKHEAVALLAERNKFAPEFLKNCVERIGLSRDDLTLRALAIIDSITLQGTPETVLEQSRAKTTIFLIVLQQRNLLHQINRVDATQALREMFGVGNTIDGAALVDVRETFAFDFRGLVLQNIEFVNYDHFWDCEFDANTIFKNSILKMLPKPEGLTISAQRGNVDLNTCVVDKSVLDAVALQKDRIRSKEMRMFEDVETFMRAFYKQGRLFPQRETYLRAKYRGSWDVFQMIKALKKSGIISTHANDEKKSTFRSELVVTKGLEPDVLKFILEDHITDALRRKLNELGTS